MIFWGDFFRSPDPWGNDPIWLDQYLSTGKAEPPTTPLDPKILKKSRSQSLKKKVYNSV